MEGTKPCGCRVVGEVMLVVQSVYYPAFAVNQIAQTQSRTSMRIFTSGLTTDKIRLIIFFAVKDGEALYSQQKQDQELTVAQIMNSLLPNSD